jgi:signal transduction histidine kinase
VNTFSKKNKYRLKWQHELFILGFILAAVPALVISLNLINKTEQELTQSVNTQLSNIANNVSDDINMFFINQIEKQYLIKKSLENETLGADEKVSLIVSAVSSIDEVVSMALIFKEKDNYSIAVQIHKHLVDSLISENNEELFNLLKNQDTVTDELLKEQEQFGNPIQLKSLNQWYIYSVLPVIFKDAPEAYLVSILNLSSLQNQLLKPSYTEVGSIFITNAQGESIFNSSYSIINHEATDDLLDLLSGESRVTGITNYEMGNKKYVISSAFTKNVKWVVIATQDYDKAYYLVSNMKMTMYFWIIGGIALALIAVFIFTGRIRKPINNLVEKANEVSKGNFDIEVDYELNDSIGTLGTTMVSMSKSLKNSFLKIEKQNKELDEYNKTLANKVLVRTQKLKETNEDLQKAYMQVLELNNEKNEFLGIAAHDLKNPLVAIKGFGSIIMDDENLNREEIEDFAGTIVESSERMFDIITSLLDINRIEEGRVEVQYANVAANEIMDTIIKQNIESAKKKDISIGFNKRSLDVEFDTDRLLIMQVLDNLISNAVKFSPMGKSIEVSIVDKPESIGFSVKDNGPGLSEQDKLKMFKKFAKLSATPTAGEHSTGLGLSIAKKIIDMLGGEIIVNSEVGHGAEFIIFLPK